MPRLLGVGSALMDLLAFVPEEFLQHVPGRKGGTELIDYDELERLLARLPAETERRPGGSAANTVAAAARLGLVEAAMLAKTGADETGAEYKRLLGEIGVDTSRFKTHPDLPTGCCLCMITPDSERTMRTYLGAASTLDAADLRAEDFRGFDLVHIEGYQLFNRALMHELLNLARSVGAQVSMDLSAPEIVEEFRDLLPELLLDHVDIVLANEGEAAAFADGADPEDALLVLAEHCRIAVVKIGDRGALIAVDGHVVHAAAEKVHAVDSTGAGDLWAAGFLSGVLAGYRPERAAELGAMLGAAVVQQVGAHLPDAVWEQIRRRRAVRGL